MVALLEAEILFVGILAVVGIHLVVVEILLDGNLAADNRAEVEILVVEILVVEIVAEGILVAEIQVVVHQIVEVHHTEVAHRIVVVHQEQMVLHRHSCLVFDHQSVDEIFDPFAVEFEVAAVQTVVVALAAFEVAELELVEVAWVEVA